MSFHCCAGEIRRHLAYSLKIIVQNLVVLFLCHCFPTFQSNLCGNGIDLGSEGRLYLWAYFFNFLLLFILKFANSVLQFVHIFDELLRSLIYLWLEHVLLTFLRVAIIWVRILLACFGITILHSVFPKKDLVVILSEKILTVQFLSRRRLIECLHFTILSHLLLSIVQIF